MSEIQTLRANDTHLPALLDSRVRPVRKVYSTLAIPKSPSVGGQAPARGTPARGRGAGRKREELTWARSAEEVGGREVLVGAQGPRGTRREGHSHARHSPALFERQDC